MYRFLFLCLTLISISHANVEYAVRIRINPGVIEGQYVYSNIIKKSYFSFRGIPYGEPPLGKLRFIPPVRPKPWDGILETKTDGPQCLQRTGGSEDCLYLNVYTPTVPCYKDSSELLPVMVYFFGGNWVQGSSNSSAYTPDFLIDKDVVLVTMNFRLNIFGYLNAMEESAPGNAGLKDQVAVLEWVQENIEQFSGNPKQVTIFGHSTGAQCVQYHMQSPLSKGLFHKAILQSGSTLNNKALERKPLEVLHLLGEVLNMSTANLTEFVDILRTMPAQVLYNAIIQDKMLNRRQTIIRVRFLPSIEHNVPGAFMPEASYRTLERGVIQSIPILTGQVSNEGGIFLDNYFLTHYYVNLSEYMTNPLQMVPKSLNIEDDIVAQRAVLNEIKHFFFNSTNPWNASFANLQTDEEYVRGIVKTIEFLRRDNHIFYYVFGYRDADIHTVYPGIGHVGELRYLWNSPEFTHGIPENSRMRRIRERMATIWTNFAKTGNPTPYKDVKLDNVKWPMVPKSVQDGTPYVYIGENMEIRTNIWRENYEFWERIFNTYGRRPFIQY